MTAKSETKLFKEFEKKFGFKAYEEILKIFARLHQKIEDLTKSRDNWKRKYLQNEKNKK